MIIKLKPGIKRADKELLQETVQGIEVTLDGQVLIVTSSKLKTLPEGFESLIEDCILTDSDIQLASRKFLSRKRTVQVGELRIGGDTNNTVIITGPCAVESEVQIEQSARLCHSLGIKILRAGCYKPRTSPYSFQGLGLEGLKLLDKMRQKYGLKIITEVRDATHVDDVIAYADIVQIGAKAMYDHGILRRCGKTRKPVLIKRGFGSTLQEFVQAAEFVLSGGNENVMLCERGIRTFETKTRFTLDLCGAAYLKYHTNLPVFLDPSHAMGYAYGVPDLARACLAMGVDGIMIETHPSPQNALSDASQQLNHEQFEQLYQSLKVLAKPLGINLI